MGFSYVLLAFCETFKSTRTSPRERRVLESDGQDNRTPMEKRTRNGSQKQRINAGAVEVRTRSRGARLSYLSSLCKKRKSKMDPHIAKASKRMTTRQMVAKPFKILDSIQMGLRSVKHGGMLPDEIKETIEADDDKS